ncbi:hypothetical protein H696_01528 [Fonticula alba]|uniref:Uncharacterized protein n=1 Tax=Fonticula alba TaxID=691883 RepID=A0A058ZF62_FONAL|nr:hypothetical protein H696_01528 [Fonticula alba]KCV72122.1 hypothetical protein H696_01528 [Fonticula alba]|eukprot:XP_009493700.1 hypothetical protein H696_01528 [Fonticula alba]
MFPIALQAAPPGPADPISPGPPCEAWAGWRASSTVVRSSWRAMGHRKDDADDVEKPGHRLARAGPSSAPSPVAAVSRLPVHTGPVVVAAVAVAVAVAVVASTKHEHIHAPAE